MSGFILYTDDGGLNWEPQLRNPDESYWSVFFIDDNEGWVVGWKSIYHTTDKGVTWEKQVNPAPVYSGDLMSVYFVNHNVGWIVGTYKTIFKTIDGGQSWTKQMCSLGGDMNWLSDVEFTSELHGCAVGWKTNIEAGFIMHTNDGGESWNDTIIESPDASGFLTVSFKDSLNGWVSGYGVCGGGATLHRTTDGGKTWGPFINTGATNSLNELTLFDNNKCFAAGDYGVLTKSIDGGENWNEISSKTRLNIRSMGFFNSNEGLAIGKTHSHVGSIIKTSVGGENWKIDSAFSGYNFEKLQLITSTAFVLEQDTGILKTNDSGQSWEWYDIPQAAGNYNDMCFVNSSTGFLCGDNGILQMTTDGGLSWINKSLSSSINITSVCFVNEEKGGVIDETKNSVLMTSDCCVSWQEASFGENTPSNLFGQNDSVFFLTTEEGVVYKTDNNGTDWLEFYVFPEQSYNPGIFFKDELEGWYFNYTNIYHTRDGGISWGNEQTFNEYGMIFDIFFLNDNSAWLGGNGALTAKYDCTAGKNDKKAGISFIKVFLNPSSGVLNIEMPDKSEKIHNIEIYSLNGSKVFGTENIRSINCLSFDVSFLISGTYVVKVKTNKGIRFSKFLMR